MEAGRRSIINDAMVRLSDGDRAAFPVLVDALWPVIAAFARKAIRADAEAEDVAQQVFLRICSRIGDFDPSKDGLSWAFGIAQYEIMSHRRRVQRRREAPDPTLLPTIADAATSQEQLLLERELHEALRQAVGSLSTEDQRALGFEAAPSPVAPPPTLRKRRQRALGRLKVLWRNLYGDP